MSKRNPPWARDELILALDMYFHHKFPIDDSSDEVKKLSKVINSLSVHPKTVKRTPAAVSMKI